MESTSIYNGMQDDHYLSRIVEQLGGSQPEEAEMFHLLRFFLVFSMGCRRVGIEDLANLFDERANRLSVMITKLGFNNKKITAAVSNQIKRWV